MRLSEVPIMSLWFILLASCLAAGLVVAAMLLWVGITAILHQHRLMGEAAITVASLGPALRSIYDGTVRQSLPDDFLDLLRKLASQKSRETGKHYGHVSS
jgi:hypothetical protein